MGMGPAATLVRLALKATHSSMSFQVNQVLLTLRSKPLLTPIVSALDPLHQKFDFVCTGTDEGFQNQVTFRNGHPPQMPLERLVGNCEGFCSCPTCPVAGRLMHAFCLFLLFVCFWASLLWAPLYMSNCNICVNCVGRDQRPYPWDHRGVGRTSVTGVSRIEDPLLRTWSPSGPNHLTPSAASPLARFACHGHLTGRVVGC